jgi:hypothetical protein
MDLKVRRNLAVLVSRPNLHRTGNLTAQFTKKTREDVLSETGFARNRLDERNRPVSLCIHYYYARIRMIGKFSNPSLHLFQRSEHKGYSTFLT